MICVAESPTYREEARASPSSPSSPTMNIPLSSQPWYHGKITRLRSEQLLETDGQFLIRDSISKPGDYVLTARWRGKALHFQVNRAEEDGRTMYQFEDEQFTSVVSLIQFYVSHRRTVTFASGCIIHEAVPVDATPAQRPRSSEYRELEANYAHFFRPGKPATPAAPARSLSQQVLLNQAMRLRREPLPAKSASPRIAPKPKVPPLPAALVNKPLPIPERSPRGDEGDEYCEMDYDAMDEMDMILNACGLSASMLTLADRSTSNSSLYSPSNSLARNYQSCADLTWRQQPGSNRQSVEFDTVRDSACVLDGSDSEESRSSGRRSEAAESRKSAGDPDYDLPKKGADDDYDMPSGTPRAVLKKSLNETFVRKLREYLLNRTAEEIALDICREDARILNFYEYTSTADNGLCKMLLPAGRDIRDLLLTRIRCLQLTVVVSILGAERRYAIRLLSQWIHVATRLLKSLGNHFAFFNVFCGLTCKMLESPAWLWTTVTDGDQARLDECTMTFDSLRNTGMTTPSAATTAIPLLQPILQIFSCADLQAVNDTDSSSSDLDSLWRWLEMAREWTSVATGLATLAVERYGQWADSPLAVASLRGLLGLDGHDDNSRFIALQTELQRAAASL